jgi:hypothetical protein
MTEDEQKQVDDIIREVRKLATKLDKLESSITGQTWPKDCPNCYHSRIVNRDPIRFICKNSIEYITGVMPLAQNLNLNETCRDFVAKPAGQTND